MPPFVRCLSVVLITLELALGASTGVHAAQGQTARTQETISCRVMESKTSSTLGVELVLFHQAEAASREQVGAFLDKHDGASVEFQTAGRDWQPATVFRLKSCFGRGLLAFPAASARLTPGQTLLVRTTGRSQ
ncbi:MAG TPA: hypothetical protein VMT20_23755 [Terriglobia bacterium]|nr:hypothetical protein [Terriglobia bacterium]